MRRSRAILGVSIRTFRRNPATLMGRLGAENRCQAGVKASAKGWLWLSFVPWLPQAISLVIPLVIPRLSRPVREILWAGMPPVK